MKELTDSLLSPAWWICVVIVGVLINLAAAYLKSRLDKKFSSFSKRWAERSESRRARREERIASLRASQHEQLLASIEELKYYIQSIECFVVSISCLSLAIFSTQILSENYKVLVLLISSLLIIFLISFLLTLSYRRDAMRTRSELEEARKVKNDMHPKENQDVIQKTKD